MDAASNMRVVGDGLVRGAVLHAEPFAPGDFAVFDDARWRGRGRCVAFMPYDDVRWSLSSVLVRSEAEGARGGEGG